MNKRLGQHFLKNKGAIKKIIDALDLQINDTVIEIGPGAGALTFPLLKECGTKNCKLIAIEKDEKLAYGVQRLADSENFKIVIDDAIKELPKIAKLFALNANSFKVVGNIPYYITGKLLRTISGLEIKPVLTVLMIQKEVAERAAAMPPQMNLLAAATQFWAEPKILFSLKPQDFDPPPKVNSAVIKLISKSQSINPEETMNYYSFLHALFKQPRKTLLNNLSNGLDLSKKDVESVLGRFHINVNARPQDLSLEEIKKLAVDFHS